MFYSNAFLCKKDDLHTITMKNDSSGSAMCKHVYKVIPFQACKERPS